MGKTYKELLHSLRQRLQRVETALEKEKNTLEDDTITEELEVLNKPPQATEQLTTTTNNNNNNTLHFFGSQKARIKHHILEVLSQGQKQKVSVKTRIVDEQQLCSKASFYRYIQELQQEQKITTLKTIHEEYYVKIQK